MWRGYKRCQGPFGLFAINTYEIWLATLFCNLYFIGLFGWAYGDNCPEWLGATA
jgi:hypothetical protein